MLPNMGFMKTMQKVGLSKTGVPLDGSRMRAMRDGSYLQTRRNYGPTVDPLDDGCDRIGKDLERARQEVSRLTELHNTKCNLNYDDENDVKDAAAQDENEQYLSSLSTKAQPEYAVGGYFTRRKRRRRRRGGSLKSKRRRRRGRGRG
jgi:hypothetical protein